MEPSRDEIRERILANIDISAALEHFANEGAISPTELWWFYDAHRIMASGEAWLMALLFEDALDGSEEELLVDPEFWKWFDRGRHRY